MTAPDRIPLIRTPGTELVKNGHGYWEFHRNGEALFILSPHQRQYIDSAIAATVAQCALPELPGPALMLKLQVNTEGGALLCAHYIGGYDLLTEMYKCIVEHLQQLPYTADSTTNEGNSK